MHHDEIIGLAVMVGNGMGTLMVLGITTYIGRGDLAERLLAGA